MKRFKGLLPGSGRRAAHAFVVVSLCATVTGCAEEPHSYLNGRSNDPVTVIVDKDRPQQVMLGGLYEEAMNRAHVPALYQSERMNENSDRVRLISEHKADLTLGCTGELLTSLNPDEAERLSQEYVADEAAGKVDKNSGEWRERVYKAMVANLPEHATAGNPSSAIGCEDVNDPPLPQNIVPVFRAAMFDRSERLTLNQVSGSISTEDVQKLTQKAAEDANLSIVVKDFLRANDL